MMTTQTPSCQRFPAFAGLLLCAALVLSACSGEKKGTADLNTPDAAQTATSSPSATVPPYTTKLKLTAEQKKEADAAAAAVVGFNEMLSSAYSDPNFDTQKLQSVAVDTALADASRDVKQARDEGFTLKSKIEPGNLQLEAISKTSEVPSAKILACIPASSNQFVKSDGSVPSFAASGDATFGFQLAKVGERWKVSRQYLRAEKC